MARLKSNGTEVARFERRRATPDDELVSERRDIVSIRSTGAVLAKSVVTFRASTHVGEHSHDYGWKLACSRMQARTRADTPETLAERYRRAGYIQLPTRS